MTPSSLRCRPDAESSTVYEVLTKSFKKFGPQKAQGMRPLEAWRTDEGYKFKAKGEAHLVSKMSESAVLLMKLPAILWNG